MGRKPAREDFLAIAIWTPKGAGEVEKEEMAYLGRRRRNTDAEAKPKAGAGGK